MKILPTLALLALTAGGLLAADDAKPAGGPYANDFQTAEPGSKPPEELFVLRGEFAVREAGGNRYLELPANPLETCGLLFGPAGHVALDVGVKVQATNAGKLFPEFGIGANDAGGYKLWVLPGLAAVELRKGDDPTPLARADFKDWQSGQWLQLRLRLTDSGGGKWKVEGKAWPATGKEPEGWTIATEVGQAPPMGRASAWGIPYAGTAIGFDELKAAAVTGK